MSAVITSSSLTRRKQKDNFTTPALLFQTLKSLEISFQNIAPFSNRPKPKLFQMLSDTTESNAYRNKPSLQPTTSSGISHFRKTHLKRRKGVMTLLLTRFFPLLLLLSTILGSLRLQGLHYLRENQEGLERQVATHLEGCAGRTPPFYSPGHLRRPGSVKWHCDRFENLFSRCLPQSFF